MEVSEQDALELLADLEDVIKPVDMEGVKIFAQPSTAQVEVDRSQDC